VRDPADPKDGDPEKDNNLFTENLISLGKLKYVQGTARPNVDCILCSIFERDPAVVSPVVWEDDQMMVVMNLYPYNPGHCMVVPRTHFERLYDLPADLVSYLFTIVQKVQRAQEIAFKCVGWNVGINDGDCSGQSIKHVHVQVVPRFKSELGFIDIIGKTRVMPIQLDQAMEMLKEAYNSLE